MWKILKQSKDRRWDIPPDSNIVRHNEKIKESANTVFDNAKDSVAPGEKIIISKAVYVIKELQKISTKKVLCSIHKKHNWITSQILFLSYLTKEKINNFNSSEKVEVKIEDIYSKDIVDFMFENLKKNI